MYEPLPNYHNDIVENFHVLTDGVAGFSSVIFHTFH